MIVCLGFCCSLLLILGCSWPELVDSLSIPRQQRLPFSTLNPEDETVAQVDIATMVWRRDQPMIQDGLWTELDEQSFSIELRKNLAQHGLRVGLMRSAVGSRLQAALANPEYDKEAQRNAGETIHHQVVTNGSVFETPVQTPVCTVEARRLSSRHDAENFWPVGPRGISAKLIVPLSDAGYASRNVSELEMQFSLSMRKLPDGQTLIHLVPMVRCALTPTSDTNVFLDSLKNKSSISKLEQRYEKLAIEATLSQDQYLVVTAMKPEGQMLVDAETWGDLALVNYPRDQQTVLVFRGASVIQKGSLQPPAKGNAWPLAWQTRELLTTPVSSTGLK